VAALREIETTLLAPRGWRLVQLGSGRYLGHSRNVGIRAARGDYVFFVDDDDIGLPHELEVLLCSLETGKVDVVSSYVAYFDTPEVPVEWTKPVSMEQLLQIKPDYGFPGVGLGAGVTRNVFGSSRFMLRRETVEAAGPFHEEWGVGREDHEYLARLSLMGATVAVLPVPLFAKRGSGGSGAPTMTHTMGETHSLQVSMRPYLAAVSGHREDLELVREESWGLGMQDRSGYTESFVAREQLVPWAQAMQQAS